MRMYDKEQIYDEQIAPLMEKILKICKANNVQMATQFYLRDAESNLDGRPMYCTSFVNNLYEDQIDYVAVEAMKWGRAGKPVILTGTIRTI